MANQPDVGDVHVNALLTNMSVGYMQEESNFIADEVFPVLFVDKQTDVFAQYNKDAWFRDHGEKMRRAPGTKAARTGYTIDATATYRCHNEAIGHAIPDELRDNADSVYKLDEDATRLVTHGQLIRRERLFHTNCMATSVWTTDKTGGSDFTKWSDYAASDPFGDFETYKNTVRQLIGRWPNKLVMGELVWRRLKHHPDFIDRIKGGATPGNPAMMTKEMLASFLEIPRILIEYATYNTAQEGATVSLSDIGNNDRALLCYTPAQPGLLVPAAGYTFVWKSATNAKAIQFIRKYREDPEKQDVIEAFSYMTHKVTAPDAGLLLVDAVD